MNKADSSSRQQLIRDLNAFVFFHLGSDATVELEEASGGLNVRLAHRRIESFQFTLSELEVESFCKDPQSFEEFMLDHLTTHRRS